MRTLSPGMTEQQVLVANCACIGVRTGIDLHLVSPWEVNE